MESHARPKYTLQIAYAALLTLTFPVYMLTTLLASAAPLSNVLSILFLPLCIPLFIILGILNIIDSFRAYKEKDAVYCVNGMLILKYGLVLFFILNFLIGIVIFLLVPLIMLVASRGAIIFALPLFLPWMLAIVGAAVVLSWLYMLPGAFWGIQVIRKSTAEGRLSHGQALLHGILQFIFLADVLDAMYLSVRIWNRGKKSAVVIGILYLAAIAGILYVIARTV